MRYYIKGFKNYFNYHGRASRKEFWLFYLFEILVLFIFVVLDGIFGFYPTKIPLDYGYMSLAYMLISGPPTICIQIRRLHDINKSGDWIWLSSVPIVSLYVIYLYLKRGDLISNKYGPVPGSKPVVKQTISHLPTIRFCRKCGFELIAGSEFCSKCGTAVVKE